MKNASVTIQTQGETFGDGLVYMLKKCPFVKSLGKLVQMGFSFVWGPDYEPTLVSSGSGFNATFDSSKCVVADRVEHHVPVFKEDVSFAFGMPAGVPASDADPAPELVPVVDVPAFDADSAPVPVIDVDAIDETHHIESSSDVPQDLADFVVHTPAEMLEDPVIETPHELMLEFHRNYDQNHPEEASHDHPQPSPDDEHVDLEPKESKIPPKHGFVPFDHLLCHNPASKHCDVCRQSKLRTRPHKRFQNKSEAARHAQVVDAPKAFLERICIDHLESTELGSKGEQYALVCVDSFPGLHMCIQIARKPRLRLRKP